MITAYHDETSRDLLVQPRRLQIMQTHTTVPGIYKVMRLTPPATCSGAQDLGSVCRWALDWRLLAAVSADLLFYDGLEHVRHIV